MAEEKKQYRVTIRFEGGKTLEQLFDDKVLDVSFMDPEQVAQEQMEIKRKLALHTKEAKKIYHNTKSNIATIKYLRSESGCSLSEARDYLYEVIIDAETEQ